MLKRILAGFLCCCLLTVMSGTVAAESNISPSTLDGYALATENTSMALFYKTKMASIAVLDKSNGKYWYSELPQDQIPADGVTNIISSEFQSLLTISYTLINKVTSIKTTSPLQSLSPEVTPTVIANGIAYVIAIENIHLAFEVDIILDGDSLAVTIPDDKIQEGAGVEKQLETKINSMVSFIDKTIAFTENILDASDYPSSFRSDLKSRSEKTC